MGAETQGPRAAAAPPDPGAIDVGAVSDFEHAVPRTFDIGDRQIGVVRWGDSFFAVRNQCPDQGGPLCAGAVRVPLLAAIAGDHVELAEEEGRPVIACPWHHYEFDLRTGNELRGGRKAVTYRVELAGGRVYVRTGAAAV